MALFISDGSRWLPNQPAFGDVSPVVDLAGERDVLVHNTPVALQAICAWVDLAS
jgi:hypothetical protein